MPSPESTPTPFNIIVAGAGVAGLEAALSLRAFGDERLAVTMLAPDPEFVYRPMVVREPFACAAAARYALDEITRDIGVELIADRLSWLDTHRRVLHTDAGRELSYDALLLALGARARPRFRHALTIDDRHLDDLLHGLIQDVEGGYVRRLAFIVPPRMGWPLPIYELALMTATCAYDMGIDLPITIITPEDAPLAIFGLAVSSGVSQLLEKNGIVAITSVHCEIPEPSRVVLHPGSRDFHADRIVALPELYGPSVRGLPGSADGFIPVDRRCRVRGVQGVYAAGDATDFAVKHGGIAAQQADVATQAIAALAGIADAPKSFRPDIHGMLLTGRQPRYLSAHITGGHGSTSEFSKTPNLAPPAKITATYLAPYLRERDRLATSAT